MRKIILLVGAVVIVLVAVAAVVIIYSPAAGLSDKEKEAALAKIAGRKLQLNDKNAATGNIEHQGKFVSFMYPAQAKIYHQTVNGQKITDQGSLEYFAFDMENPRVNVVTEVIPAPSSVINLSDYPGVRLRQDQQDQYAQTSAQTSNGVNGLAFDKAFDNSFEKTAFFLTAGRIYTFSIASVDKKIEDQIFNKMISTLKLY